MKWLINWYITKIPTSSR